MTPEIDYKAVCHDCGWESEGADYRDRPHTQKGASKACVAHAGNNHGCSYENTEVVAVPGGEAA